MPFAASEALDLLLQANAQQRLAHAYLITGPAGCGKSELAFSLCARLLGTTPESAKTHPDVHTIAPESKSRRILVEQMRELEQKLQMRSLSGGARFGILVDADRLMPQAANAFLKTLEEPPADTHLLLLTEHPEQLLETILSRCVEVPLRALGRRERSDAEKALIEILRHFFQKKQPSLAGGLGLAQNFQSLLATTKETIQDKMDAEAKAEEKQYKQTVDPKWFAQREELFAARAEAVYAGERNRLLEVLEAFWADVLLAQQNLPAQHLPECADQSGEVARSLSGAEVLRRVQATHKLREHLNMSGVNEALAIEHAMLCAFAPR